MRLKDLYPSRYLKADDITETAEGELRALIRGMKLEEMQDNDGGKEDKPVLYFIRVEKGLVMNKTNAETIAGAYGDETDVWTGKEVLLVVESVRSFGKMVPGIRIRIPRKPTSAPQPAPQPAPAQQPAEPVAAVAGTEPAESDTPF